MQLKDKRVIITAAASGMGRAGVELFAKEGAFVVAVDRDGDGLASLAKDVRAAGGKVETITADLLDTDVCRDVVNKSAEIMGGLDVLWAHAGLPGKREIEDLDLDAYERTMNLNVRTGLVMTSAAIPHLRKTKGSILFTASIAGLKGASVSPIYSAAKFAVIGMGRSLSSRYAPEGIRVNVVCPGPVETPMLPQFMDPDADPELAKQALQRTRNAVPLGRVGRPEEIAAAALWLSSDAASFVTGVALPVDGGTIA